MSKPWESVSIVIQPYRRECMWSRENKFYRLEIMVAIAMKKI